TTYTYSKVGIGTNAPSQALTVAGNAQVSGSVSANNITSNNVTSTSVNTSKVYGEGAVPAGAIMMWSGSPTTLPIGWALCDGLNGTPDLRGRFIVGFNPSTIEYSTIGNTGGLSQVLLTADQSGLPAHDHLTARYEVATTNMQANGFTWPPLWAGTVSNGATTQPCTAQNAQQAHENRPPYYVLAYIIKLTY
ncbi:MAG: hypothetical protein MUE33_09880, partial [Cytophagaceae bacterium]|nr:hypothetical protein [Cytophagaceae bacterium]